ncbi:hypothetical protein [Bauldia sp.]|uniref:hypothetical protein n=1 Tax=Bauldia sp. TaxID=2575872 RepID=UPI003BA9857F
MTRANHGWMLRSGAVLAVVLGTSAGSIAASECVPFEIVSDGSDRTVEYIDHGAEGPSLGDRRIGRRSAAVSGQDGTATVRWIVESVSPDGEEPSIVADQVAYIFDDGTLFTRKIGPRIGAAPDVEGVSSGGGEGAVVGGTGVFAFARGTYEITRDGLTSTIRFDIRCD